MEPKIKLFCNEEQANELNELSSKLWMLNRAIEKDVPESESLDTYTPIAEILKIASWLLDIASNISYYEKPF